MIIQTSFDSRICHASGERCLGCPHYYGKAPICSCSPDFKAGPESKPPDWEDDSANYRQAGGDHYLYMSVQPWEAMEAWMSAEAFRGYLRGNAIKYLARCDAKGGIEDIRKAQHYLDRLLESYAQEGEG